jgi:serine protease Do
VTDTPIAMNTSSRPNWKLRVSLLAVVLGLAAAGTLQAERAPAKEKNPPLKLQTAERSGGRVSEAVVRTTFAPVVKEVAPSVVNIFTSTKPRRAEPSGLEGIPPQLLPFFGQRFGPAPEMRTPRQHGLGSGVIVTEDGYILTNNHVVQGADDIRVALNPDGREYTAKVIGRDPASDLAVLKIDADNLTPMRLGDSDVLEVGDLVLAVGNPFGVGQSVTMGIVGGKGRAQDELGLRDQDFIQTDAPINPGNSGGALVDAAGRLVGINTAIVSRTGGNHGIGFAVPVNLARNVMEDLVQDGRVTRGYLGVNIQDVTPALARQFELERPQGALVAEVSPRSPAEKAGLKGGDVITEFNGKPVQDSRQLRLMVGQTAPDSEVDLRLLRDGRERKLGVVLSELPRDNDPDGRDGRDAEHEGGLQGVMVDDLNAQHRRQFNIPAGVEGALVTRVAPDSPAAEAGLQPGDVIREINRRPVADSAELLEAARRLEHEAVLLKLWSRGGNRFLVVDETKP